jgi:hypothetical protein
VQMSVWKAISPKSSVFGSHAALVPPAHMPSLTHSVTTSYHSVCCASCSSPSCPPLYPLPPPPLLANPSIPPLPGTLPGVAGCVSTALSAATSSDSHAHGERRDVYTSSASQSMQQHRRKRWPQQWTLWRHSLPCPLLLLLLCRLCLLLCCLSLLRPQPLPLHPPHSLLLLPPPLLHLPPPCSNSSLCSALLVSPPLLALVPWLGPSCSRAIGPQVIPSLVRCDRLLSPS